MVARKLYQSFSRVDSFDRNNEIITVVYAPPLQLIDTLNSRCKAIPVSVPKKAIHIKVSVWQLKKKVQENAFVSL